MNRNVKAQMLRASKNVSSREGAFCKYSHRDCMQNCVEGYGYCIRHILEDKTAPFRQCTYITRSGKKCPCAAPKQDKKDGFCADHARKTLMSRQRGARKRRPKETVDSLLEELALTCSPENQHVNEHRRGKVHSDSIANRALDYASSSESETDPLLVEHSWRDNCDSDAESVDSDQEDILKYAGVYTTEEVAQILRDKLIRLQALYIDQFKRLKHILLTKRRKCLEAHKTEKELYGSIKLYKNNPRQKDKYNKLCAMKRYHKKFGKEALLQRQSTQRRMQMTEGVNFRPPAFPKCVFMDECVRCNARVIPLSKFCQRHILHDQNQVLYQPCPFADSQCGRPVPALIGTHFCSLHQPSPPVVSFEALLEDEDDQPDYEFGQPLDVKPLEVNKSEQSLDLKKSPLQDLLFEKTAMDEEINSGVAFNFTNVKQDPEEEMVDDYQVLTKTTSCFGPSLVVGDRGQPSCRGFPTSKHYLYKWRKERKKKVIKIDLPNFAKLKKDADEVPETPDEVRKKLKKEGRLPPRTFQELPINISCTRELTDPYEPHAGDSKLSSLSPSKITGNVATGTKTFRALRAIRKYEEFDAIDFAEQAQNTVLEAQALLQNLYQNQDKLHELVTEKAFPEMVHGLETKTLKWHFIESVEPPRMVQARTQPMIAKENVFAQVTVRLHTKQILAIYDRFGRLMYGNPNLPKSVVEYVVLEKWISDTYGKWRLHGKILPDAVHSQDSLLKTYRVPTFDPLPPLDEDGDEGQKGKENVL